MVSFTETDKNFFRSLHTAKKNCLKVRFKVFNSLRKAIMKIFKF